MTDQTNAPTDTVYIIAHSLRGFTLAIQEYFQQGYVMDMSNDGVARPFTNMFTTRMTKLPQEHNEIIRDWNVTPVVHPIVAPKPTIVSESVNTQEKRKAGRPAKGDK